MSGALSNRQLPTAYYCQDLRSGWVWAPLQDLPFLARSGGGAATTSENKGFWMVTQRAPGSSTPPAGMNSRPSVQRDRHQDAVENGDIDPIRAVWRGDRHLCSGVGGDCTLVEGSD